MRLRRGRGLGLIPAHAGKTHGKCAHSPGRWAHPRSRGENRTPPRIAATAAGSSPLTRGKRHSQRHRLPTDRLIPAHAGKTVVSSMTSASMTAHPRSRGENVSPPGVRAPAQGSSPLTRGKPLRVRQAREREGLIPAHAGKTRRICGTATPTWAHPRSRGENRQSRSKAPPMSGSSPLTRGKPPPQHKPNRPRWAHPRSRGENRDGVLKSMSIGGSSPLTRGKRQYREYSDWSPGLIPAHAGKTAR